MTITRYINGTMHHFVITSAEQRRAFLEYQHLLDREDIETLYDNVFTDEQLDEIAHLKRSVQDGERSDPLAWNEAVDYAIEHLGYRAQVEAAEARND